MTAILPATREAALAALHSFLPRIPTYAARRNFATADNRDVSRLSPYLRRRLITEREVVLAALENYSFQVAEKFIQEVVWRTYWKGWLERNRGVWAACVERDLRLRQPEPRAPWDEVYQRASKGDTHLSFFNDWVRELVSTGYLHNHVRMWFASVWIFTLKLPWQLGAMLMYRHLLDGDPASNTLSWRWVAGLQTKGKSYLARADNIATFSEGRWSPKPGELAEQGCAIESDVGVEGVAADTMRPCDELPVQGYGVLTTCEDLSVECDERLFSRACALLHFRNEHGESELVETFARASDEDALTRVGSRGRGVSGVSDVLAWCHTEQFSKVVIVQPPVGPNAPRVHQIAQALREQGIECFLYRCEWDRHLHELADKGFFPFWERVKKRIQRGEPLFHGKNALE